MNCNKSLIKWISNLFDYKRKGHNKKLKIDKKIQFFMGKIKKYQPI